MKYQTVPKRGRVAGWDPQAFRRARVDARLTWRELAERLAAEHGVHLSIPALHGYGNKVTPALALLNPLARVLGVPQHTLLRK